MSGIALLRTVSIRIWPKHRVTLETIGRPQRGDELSAASRNRITRSARSVRPDSSGAHPNSSPRPKSGSKLRALHTLRDQSRGAA